MAQGQWSRPKYERAIINPKETWGPQKLPLYNSQELVTYVEGREEKTHDEK